MTAQTIAIAIPDACGNRHDGHAAVRADMSVVKNSYRKQRG